MAMNNILRDEFIDKRLFKRLQKQIKEYQMNETIIQIQRFNELRTQYILEHAFDEN